MPEGLPSPIESWNNVIKSLQLAKQSFLVHQQIMEARPKLEELPIEAQQRLKFAFHRSSDFARFMLSFVNHWRVSGGLDEMFIPVKEKKTNVKKTK